MNAGIKAGMSEATQWPCSVLFWKPFKTLRDRSTDVKVEREPRRREQTQSRILSRLFSSSFSFKAEEEEEKTPLPLPALF